MKRRGCTEVAVVVRTRNAKNDLSTLLDRLENQSVKSVELIIVDNESEDNTRQLALDHGATIVDISRSEFSWGRALNRGIAASSGNIVILLSADAWPLHSDWLRTMLDCFDDDRVGAVFGRQVPRRDAPLDEWVRVSRAFPVGSRHWTNGDLGNGRVRDLIASNACAAIRRDVWEQVKYDESLLGAEEPVWVEGVLQRGYSVHYMDQAVVEHSHRDSALRQAIRVWELSVQGRLRAGERTTYLDIAKIAGSFVRRRMRNLCLRGSGLGRRLEGFWRLPWETAMLVFVVSATTLWGVRMDELHRKW